jgi:hypothetical protein
MSVHCINSVNDFLGFILSPAESIINVISDLISLFIPIKIPSPKKSIEAIPIPRVKIGFLALQPVKLSASMSSQNPKATNAIEPINNNNDFFLLE